MAPFFEISLRIFSSAWICNHYQLLLEGKNPTLLEMQYTSFCNIIRTIIFMTKNVNFFVCLYVWKIFIPFEKCSLIWTRNHYRWRAAKFDLCSARMFIEQWWFFSVPHLLWQGAFVTNGHLWGPVTHTYFWAFGSGTVTTLFYDLGLSRLAFKHLTSRLWGERS